MVRLDLSAKLLDVIFDTGEMVVKCLHQLVEAGASSGEDNLVVPAIADIDMNVKRGLDGMVVKVAGRVTSDDFVEEGAKTRRQFGFFHGLFGCGELELLLATGLVEFSKEGGVNGFEFEPAGLKCITNSV